MGLFAVIDDLLNVTNIIDADSKEVAEEVTGHECIEYTFENPASIGFKYDRDSNTFIDQSTIEVVEEPTI
jgi:hypothetical protein